MKKLLIFLLLCSSAWCGTVRLVNDSAYKLRAVIRAADGTYLGEVIVNPLQTMSWNDYWGGIGYYNQSRTPYTVIWFCADGGDFSLCDNVPTGATVTCHNCEGLRSCKPKKKEANPPLKGTPTEENLQDQTEEDAGPP